MSGARAGLALLAVMLGGGADAGATSAATADFANGLATATSGYLRGAASSPVAWQPWGAQAFSLARELDRPILLAIGAGWCHWCHVMDREAYTDGEIAALINEHFVPVKVDRDERPDLDAWYQAAARMVFDTGGWPLTLFLTPDGKVITGGSTFLADERDGLPGFRRFLPRFVTLYRQRRDELVSSAEAGHRLLATPDLSARGDGTGGRAADEILDAALERFDATHGGFGDGAKHVPAGILGLVLRRYAETKDPRLYQVVTRTLQAMATGAIRDQLDGGFFRYTTDRAWREPHWEKLDYIQAQLLIVYLEAYRMTGDRAYRDVAEGLLRYIRRVLALPEGGVKAHEDADGPNGDAAHYLWSAAEIRRAVPRAEADVLLRHFGLGPTTERRAPAVEATPLRIAADTGMPVGRVQALLESGKAGLRRARAARGEPAVDPTVYADRNGLMASACIEAYKALGDRAALDLALRTLEFLGSRLRQPDGGLAHAYAGGRTTVPGFLNDQLTVAAAHLDAFEVTADPRHLATARALAQYAMTHFWDTKSGGFFDRVPTTDDPPSFAERIKPFVDDEMPAGNPLAAVVLERLHGLTTDPDYRRRAREVLAAFPGSAARLGPLVATYGYAADQFHRGSLRAVIVGAREDPRTETLWRAAARAFRPGKMVLTLDPASQERDWVPAPVAAVLAAATGGMPQAYVCTGSVCALPVSDPDRVRALVEGFGRVR